MDSVSIGLHLTGPNEVSWPLTNEEKKWETDVHILFTGMVANLLKEWNEIGNKYTYVDQNDAHSQRQQGRYGQL